jgi:hypothetical protein
MSSRPLESVKEKSSEPELEGNIRKPARASASVWQRLKSQPGTSVRCCAKYQKFRWTKLTILLLSFKRSDENYRLTANALNATLLNTQHSAHRRRN